MTRLFSFALLAFTIFASSAAHAEVIGAMGANLSFEYGSDGRSVETRQPFSLRGGYRFEIADVYLEYQNFRVSEGTSMVFVSREHQEWLAWGRKLFRPDWKLAPYVALGAGFAYDSIDTTLGSTVSRDQGGTDTLLAAAGGLRTLLWEKLEVAVEGRVATSPRFAPNPSVEIGLLAGFLF